MLAERLPHHAQLRLAVLGPVELVVARGPRGALEVSGRWVAAWRQAIGSHVVGLWVPRAFGSRVLLGQLRAEERPTSGEEGLHPRVLGLARQARPRGHEAREGGRVPQLLGGVGGRQARSSAGAGLGGGQVHGPPLLGALAGQVDVEVTGVARVHLGERRPGGFGVVCVEAATRWGVVLGGVSAVEVAFALAAGAAEGRAAAFGAPTRTG